MDIEYYLGIDMDGEGRTTCVMVEKRQDKREEEATYEAQAVHEYAADQASDAVAGCVQSVLADRRYAGRVQLVVNDSERKGRELISALAAIGLTPLGVAISGADSATQHATGLAGTDVDGDADTSGFIVSEHDLVETLDDLFHTGRLEVSSEDDALQRMVVGIGNYREAGSERGVEHARYVIAGALACWLGEQHSFDPTERLGGWEPTMGEASEKRRTTSTS